MGLYGERHVASEEHILPGSDEEIVEKDEKEIWHAPFSMGQKVACCLIHDMFGSPCITTGLAC